MYCIRGTRVLPVDIISSEHYCVSEILYSNYGSFVTIPVFVLPYCTKYSHTIPILPILIKFLSQSLPIAYSPSIAFSLSIIVHARWC